MAHSTTGIQDAKTTEALIAEWRTTGDEHLREQIIELQRPIVEWLARKLVRPGVEFEDLEQTAWVSVVRALDRFDPSFTTTFSTYVTHCVSGELKRYFRDRTWAMKAPRSLQDVAARLGAMQSKLVTTLGREPSVPEMAQAFSITEDHLAQAMELRSRCRVSSLDDVSDGRRRTDGEVIGDVVGREDPRIEATIEYAPLYAAMEQLEPREQLILRRRFIEGYHQNEVARELGLSQMHVSRLERDAIQRLRRRMAGREGSLPTRGSRPRTPARGHRVAATA